MLGFNALSSSPISAQAETAIFVTATLNVTAVVAPNLTLVNQLVADITATNVTAIIEPIGLDKIVYLLAAVDATATVAPNLTQIQPITASVSSTATVSAAIVLDHPLVVAIDATATVAPNLTLVQPLTAALDVTAVVAPNLTLVQPLTAALDVTAVSTGNAVLAHPLVVAIDATAVVAPNLTLVQPLASSIDATAVVAPNLTLIQPLVSSINAVVSITGNAVLDNNLVADITATNVTATMGPVTLEKIVYLLGDINATAVVSGNAVLDHQVVGELSAVASAEASSLDLVKALSASITATAEIYADAVRLLIANVSCTASTVALLDVDGNTEGSPGGIAAPGFTPLSSIVLAQHIESAPTATYTITADFDPLLETEITSVFFNDNPANVLSYSIIGPDVFITANTPADVYAQASTFMVKREVVPYYNESFNYNVRFNTAVKRDNAGNNFYSDKFYDDQNAICYLSDDGQGIIDLYEEVTPGNSVKLKSIGKIDYTTGFVEVRGLTITSMYDLQLFFYVESLDSVIPTQDYFTTQNNLLVQSKTITFPTGEKVEISQYEKQTDIVDLEIYVTARSYSLAAPLTTVEERTATYVIRIVPDYDLGKAAILQLIEEQAV